MSQFSGPRRVLRHVALSAVLAFPPASALAQSAAPPVAPTRSVASLFAGVGHDFVRLGKEAPLLILGAGSALAALGSTADRRVVNQLSRSQAADRAFEAGEVAGDAFVQVGAAAGTWAIGQLSHKPTVTAVGADLVEAQIVSGVITQGLKLMVSRKRPNGSANSFPSGHSSASFTTADVLQRHFGWRVGVPAYALAAYIGASRMSENKHYLSDVIFGAAIGIASSRTLSIGQGRQHVTMVPIVTRGGGAIVFSALPQAR